MKQEDFKTNRKGLIFLVRWIGSKIGSIFQPEEVEVTFNGEGKNITYTYTKVSK